MTGKETKPVARLATSAQLWAYYKGIYSEAELRGPTGKRVELKDNPEGITFEQASKSIGEYYGSKPKTNARNGASKTKFDKFLGVVAKLSPELQARVAEKVAEKISMEIDL